ncbi:MAG TPA: hypothetical protein VH308_01555 [Terracidiphilus sp.]|nr:hypothetical protein [Terracidiphilus sp.]
MKSSSRLGRVWAALLGATFPLLAFGAPAAAHHTIVSIRGDSFCINGQPTYAGRTWQGHNIQGLLFNSRMVQGIFDDLNPETSAQWVYPDTHKWDSERNTNEFVAAMPEWRRHGLLAFTLNLQGGSPQGYSKQQPWLNSAFTSGGTLRPAYTARLERILNRADELGMVVILGYFYVAQSARLDNEAAIIRATDNATQFLLRHGWRNVLVEIDNECDVGFRYPILKPDRVSELIARVKNRRRRGRRLLVGTSFRGGAIPTETVVRVSDFLLLHGNGVSHPEQIAEMVRKTRAVPGYTTKPVLFNEDDHFDFDQPENNMTSALRERASWGYFDYRMKGENFAEGYQSVPTDWKIDSPRKRAFFRLLAQITGAEPLPDN